MAIPGGFAKFLQWGQFYLDHENAICHYLYLCNNVYNKGQNQTTVVLLKTKQNVDFSPYLFQPLMEQSVFNRFWLGFVHA